jgi:hypothetical protein
VYLQEDPDEEDRSHVVLHVIFPRTHPLDRLEDQRRCYYDLLVQRCPPGQYPDPICGLTIGFAEE